ncbi:STAS domain-containing protein [Nocardioides terrae]|nr:STAS domain-containing protein [Nocardioides terrae]
MPRLDAGAHGHSPYLVNDDVVVITLSDRTVRDVIFNLRWRLEELLTTAPTRLVIDASQVSRLSSPAIAALLWANRHCAARGVRVAVRDAGPTAGLLRRTGLEGVLDVEPDRR